MNKIKFYVFTIIILSLPLIAQKPEILKSTLSTQTRVDSLLTEDYVYRKKPNIAILPFANANTQAKEAEFGQTVSSMLSTALRNKTNFIVLERSELHEILSEQVLELSGLTKEKTQKLGKLYNVEVILVGDVSLIDYTLHIDARLIETNSSKITVALYGTCHDLKKIRTVIEDLAKELEQTYLRQWMGRISISSQPAGAEVYLENKFIGLTDVRNPLKISNLLEGTYPLRLICGGYYDWEGEIAILAKMERNIKISLIAKPGSMNIYSEPSHARIFLDNNSIGHTPMSLKTVAEGEHEIRLIKENYKEWTQKVVVRSFQPTDVKATLEVSPGTLTVNSKPAKANIYFKGKFVAKTPHTLSNIPPGEIVVRVEKEGYEEWTTSVLIQPNKHEISDVVMKRKMGTLSITSRPEGAMVYLGKQGQGKRQNIGETPLLNYTTTIGKYTLEIEKKDYFNSKKQVIVKHQQLADVRFELKEKPGTIFVNTTPANTRIFLDGIYIGRSPFLIKNIKKGEYQITMRLPYAEESRKIIVEPNRQAIVKANFKKSKRYIFAMTSIGITGVLFHYLAK